MNALFAKSIRERVFQIPQKEFGVPTVVANAANDESDLSADLGNCCNSIMSTNPKFVDIGLNIAVEATSNVVEFLRQSPTADYVHLLSKPFHCETYNMFENCSDTASIASTSTQSSLFFIQNQRNALATSQNTRRSPENGSVSNKSEPQDGFLTNSNSMKSNANNIDMSIIPNAVDDDLDLSGIDSGVESGMEVSPLSMPSPFSPIAKPLQRSTSTKTVSTISESSRCNSRVDTLDVSSNDLLEIAEQFISSPYYPDVLNDQIKSVYFQPDVTVLSLDKSIKQVKQHCWVGVSIHKSEPFYRFHSLLDDFKIPLRFPIKSTQTFP